MRTLLRSIVTFAVAIFVYKKFKISHLLDNRRSHKAGADSLPRADRDLYRPKDPEIVAGTRVTRGTRVTALIEYFTQKFGMIGALAGFFSPSGDGEHVYQEFTSRINHLADRVRPYAAGPDDVNNDAASTSMIKRIGAGGGTNDTGEPTSSDNHWPPPGEEEFVSDGDEPPVSGASEPELAATTNKAEPSVTDSQIIRGLKLPSCAPPWPADGNPLAERPSETVTA